MDTATLREFATLGRAIDRAWDRARRHQADFSKVAQELLSDGLTNLPPVVEILRHVASAPPLPPQTNSSFSDAPTTLFVADDFFLEVLTWVTSTTAIHQHEFAGAFSVLQGSSVHTRWEWETQTALGEHMLAGELRYAGSELLVPGVVRAIAPGRSFVHSLFHLEAPTITLVARTTGVPGFGIQWQYHPPGIAIDPFHRPPSLSAALRLLKALSRGERGLFRGAFEAFIGNTGSHGAFCALDQLQSSEHIRANWTDFFELARERFSEHANAVEKALAEGLRREQIIARRAPILDPDLRFFLALLLNVPNRAAILRLAHERVRECDAATSITTWASRLSGTDVSGVEFDEANVLIFDALLRADIPAGGDIVGHVRRHIRDVEIEASDDQLLSHIERLRETAFFRDLLRDGGRPHDA